MPWFIVYGDEIGAIIAPIIFIIAGITDFFDGFLARKYNVTSNFGKIITLLEWQIQDPFDDF